MAYKKIVCLICKEEEAKICVNNCVKYILRNHKKEKKIGYLLDKDDVRVPLSTYHVHYPLISTNKIHKFQLQLYEIKTTTSNSFCDN